MRPAKLLFLELGPDCELGAHLAALLASEGSERLEVQRPSAPGGMALERAREAWPRALAQVRPALSLLVAPRSALPDLTALLTELKGAAPEQPLVVASDAQEPAALLDLIAHGASDFLLPPLTPPSVLPRLWRLLDAAGAEAREAAAPVAPGRLIGRSEAFLQAVRRLPQLAACDATVLISGETGTGKELCARTLHELSPRAGGPFVAVNCGAIPVELIENELFGHQRGAFTSAATAETGQIEAAEGGTLFLDEVDSLPLLAQVKLLRFLQEREYKPLGCSRVRRGDVRVITATGVSLERGVREGRIRQDLYYRLNILPVLLPPLRERRDDIPLLVAHFLGRFAEELRLKLPRVSPAALQRLLAHEWPGNVRELEHVLLRSVLLLERGTLEAADVLLPASTDPPAEESFKHMKARVVGQAERTYLTSLLTAHRGNVTRAAEGAQKNRRAFFELLRKHRIDPREFKAPGPAAVSEPPAGPAPAAPGARPPPPGSPGAGPGAGDRPGESSG